ncbi:MAG: DUF2892 domain-containing protein [Reichenbachiella sp.]
MKKNIGKVDKAIRLIMSIAMIVAYFMLSLSPIWGIVLIGSGATLILTVVMNWCPMCALLGINTCEVSPKKS